MGRHLDALAAYDELLDASPDDDRVLRQRGICLSELGREQEAVESFERAVSINPDDVLALRCKAIALTKMGRFEHGVRTLDRVLEIDPGDTSSSRLRGVALAESGHPRLAVEDFEQALEADPNDWIALRHLGTCLGRLGDHEQALQAFDQALSLRPGEPLTLRGRAAALTNLERHAEALADLDGILEDAPGDVPALLARGQVLESMGRPEEARWIYRRCLQEADDADGEAADLAAFKCERLEGGAGDADPAARMLDRLVRFCITTQEHLFVPPGSARRGGSPLTDPEPSFDADFPSLMMALGRGRPGGGAERCCSGYLVVHEGHGLVVDPGPGFVRAMALERLRAADVGTVVVTGPQGHKAGDLEELLAIVTHLRRESPRAPRVDLMLSYPAFVKYGSWIATAYQDAVGELHILHPGLRHHVPAPTTPVTLVPLAARAAGPTPAQGIAGLMVLVHERPVLVVADGPCADWGRSRQRRPSVLLLATRALQPEDLGGRSLGDDGTLGVAEALHIARRLEPQLTVLAHPRTGPPGVRHEVAAGMSDELGCPVVVADGGLATGLSRASIFCQLRKTFIRPSRASVYEKDSDRPLMYFDRALERRLGPQGLDWAYDRVLGDGGALVQAALRFARRQGT
jgi:tetratricopeptide (TPR) repeat protein